MQNAGNVILLAERPTDSAATRRVCRQFPDQGFALDDPGVSASGRWCFRRIPSSRGAAAGFGHNLFVLDPDGPMRTPCRSCRTGHIGVPSLGVAAALRAAGITPGAGAPSRRDPARWPIGAMPLATARMATEDGVVTYLLGAHQFRGPALLDDLKSRPYPSYSFFDLLYSDEQILSTSRPKVDPSVFRDKIVFVGATAAGLSDVFETPFAGGKMPGIQIHAAVADDILSNRFMGRPSDARGSRRSWLPALVVGLVATLLPAWWATAHRRLSRRCSAWAPRRVVRRRLLAESVAAGAGVVGRAVWRRRATVLRRRPREAEDEALFGRYVSKDVYDQLVANPRWPGSAASAAR